jgi:hypothetical protein
VGGTTIRPCGLRQGRNGGGVLDGALVPPFRLPWVHSLAMQQGLLSVREASSLRGCALLDAAREIFWGSSPGSALQNGRPL